jgi:hypothetical protein
VIAGLLLPTYIAALEPLIDKVLLRKTFGDRIHVGVPVCSTLHYVKTTSFPILSSSFALLFDAYII